ncbi:MAG TPA: hypothetical protein PLB55_14550 [Prosthecobacter sp.]|nr:hypothetical protein [Prosthecobacter sp.]
MKRILILLMCLFGGGGAHAEGFLKRLFQRGPSSAEVEQKLRDCRSDKRKYNAIAAENYFRENPSTHRRLREEFDAMDEQGKGIVLDVLSWSEAVELDGKLRTEVFKRAKSDTEPTDADEFFAARAAAHELLTSHPKEAAPYMLDYVTSEDFEDQYAVLRAINENKLWSHYERFYSPERLRKMAKKLKDDSETGNAIDATYFFELLGKRAEPVLREVALWPDAQARNVAKNLLLHLDGKISERELEARLEPLIHPDDWER